VVGIAERERIRQREVEGNFVFLEVAHRNRVLVARPLIHPTVVPGLLAVMPVVRRSVGALRIADAAVQVERHQQLAVPHALLPHIAPLRQRNGEAVAEAAYAGERAEIMVESAVLLHQDHHMLDVPNRAGRIVGGDGEGALDGGREGGVSGSRDTRLSTIA
jgi:hypothetical protein